MENQSAKYYCKNCNSILSQNLLVCPYCECSERYISFDLEDNILIQDDFRGKKITPDIKGFAIDIKQGWEKSNDIKKFPKGVIRTQIVDRENNSYSKIVADTTTGKLVKNLKEPLSSHKNKALNTLNPPWYKLIKVLKHKKIIETGLTIPYIFGVYKEIGTPFNSIEDLISHIMANPLDKYPVIDVCGKLEEPVVSIEDKSVYNKPKIYEAKLERRDGKSPLFVHPNTNLGKTLSSFISNLKVRYDDILIEERFSFNKKEKRYVKFESEEIEMIKSILGDLKK